MSKIIAIILVTLSAFFWGANFNAGKIAVEHLSPIMAAALRFGLASILIIPVLLLCEKNIGQTIKNNIGMYIILGIIGIAGFNGLFFLGLKYTTPVNGALIMATNPLITIIFATLILKDVIRFNQKTGMTLSFLGVLAVITHGSISYVLQLKVATGDFIIMAANICWALYGVLGKRYLKNSKPLITTSVTMIIGSLLLIALASYNSTVNLIFSQTSQVYAALIYMAVFGSILAYLFWNYGISHLGASNTSIFFNFVPIFTALISIFNGQSITPIQFLGGALVIIGVLISSGSLKFSIKTQSQRAVLDN